MDELHAAIAAYLHRAARVQSLKRRHEVAIMAIWYERAAVPHCRYCGKPITAGDDAFDVEQLRAARACVNHFAPF